MAQPSKFGKLVKQMRDDSGLSLLTIHKAGGPDASYIHRIERGKVVNPGPEVVARLARAFAAANAWSMEKLWETMDLMFETAGFAAPPKPDDEAIRREFSKVLRKRQLDEEQIGAAVANVPVLTMLQVIEGDEPLEIRPVSEFPRSSASHRETFVLPAKKHVFPAGPSADLHVRSELTPSKREQLKMLAKLAEKIIAD